MSLPPLIPVAKRPKPPEHPDFIEATILLVQWLNWRDDAFSSSPGAGSEGFYSFEGDDSSMDIEHEAFVCGTSGCNEYFTSQTEWEIHYRLKHSGTACETCHRVFPNVRLTELHIQEAHDSYFAVKAAAEPSYVCLVEGCPKVCSSDAKRRLHLIDVHGYPKSFRFHRRSKRAKETEKAEKETETEMQIDQGKKDNSNAMDLSELSAALPKIPAVISFGRRGRGRGRLGHGR